MSISRARLSLTLACAFAWGISVGWFLTHGVDSAAIYTMIIALLDLMVLELVIASQP
jgi:hypothetical protein